MIAMHSIRDVALATLLLFGAGCTFISGPYQGGYNSVASQRPKPAKQPQKGTHKPSQGKPTPPQTQPHRPKPKPQPQPQPQPQPKPPRPQPGPDPTPNGSQIVVPVRVDFASAVAKVDSMVQKTLSQDWQTVSAKGAAVKVEARYKVWRDPIKAKFDNNVLKVDVNVHYAADVRASAKNPFGGTIWLTKGMTWGTQANPQKVTAQFQASFRVEDDYRITADAKLVDIDHGKAPTGEVCVKSVVKVCMTKEAMAPMVHKQLEAALVPRIQKALGDADKQFEKAMNLKGHAQQLWTVLQKPLPLQQIGQANCPSEFGKVCSTPAWLLVRPDSLGVSQPRMDGKDLRVDLAIDGELEVKQGDAPAVKPKALPKLAPVTGKPGFVVHAKLRVPTDALGAELSKQMQNENILGGTGAGLDIVRVSLLDTNERRFPHRITAVVTVRGAINGDLKVHGDLKWDAKRRELSLENVDYTVASDNPSVQKLSEQHKAALLKLVAQKARWKLDTKVGSLNKAITRALGGAWLNKLRVNGELGKLQLERFSVDNGVLAADVVLAGQLDIALTP